MLAVVKSTMGPSRVRPSGFAGASALPSAHPGVRAGKRRGAVARAADGGVWAGVAAVAAAERRVRVGAAAEAALAGIYSAAPPRPPDSWNCVAGLLVMFSHYSQQ